VDEVHTPEFHGDDSTKKKEEKKKQVHIFGII